HADSLSFARLSRPSGIALHKVVGFVWLQQAGSPIIGRRAMVMGKGGRPTAEKFREMRARCGEPVGAPTRLTAERIWDLVAPVLGFELAESGNTASAVTARGAG